MTLVDFNSNLDAINKPVLRALAAHVLAELPAEFFDMPASRSGKHHPPQALGQGGLLWHTHATCKVGAALAEIYDLNNVDRDVLQTGLILHDIGKAMIATPTSDGHDKVGANWLVQIVAANALFTGNQYVNAVLCIVRWHMGRWATDYSPVDRGLLVRLAHEADYLVSRKWFKL